MMAFGTTIVTNAIVQGKLGRVALLTTAGHGDVLDIARQSRRVLYDLATPPPAPVPRGLRFEIDARMRPDGAAAAPVNPDQVRDVLKRLDGAVDSIAVSLLHAYADSEHERVVGELCREAFPHASLSHEVWPQLRERAMRSRFPARRRAAPARSRRRSGAAMRSSTATARKSRGRFSRCASPRGSTRRSRSSTARRRPARRPNPSKRRTAVSWRIVTPVYARDDLGSGRTLEGPLVVVDRTSTTVMLPGCRIGATPHGHLRIEVGEAP